jgi:DegV family protein with EDD domain
MENRPYVIITDGFSNLPGHLLKALDIRILPCTYFVEGEPVHYNGDIETFDSHTYYKGIREGKVITTALVNSESFLTHFRPCVEQGQDILYIGLSSGVSGTYQAAVMAGQELMEEFPACKIRTVDSLGAGLGVGLLACRASDLRAEGKTLAEAADILEQEKLCLCEFFTVGTLEYLKRSGRVSAATAAIGSVLNIKPLLYGDYEGHIVSCAKPRGRKKAIEAILEKYRKMAVEPENRRVFISHGDCLDEAQLLADQVCAIAKPKELIICPHEPFTGCHVGPGMLALYFMGTARLD